MRRGPREPLYIRGDFYRVDDRTGFKVRASEEKKEWTELIVSREVYEYRHPQDFVAGVLDDQTVPDGRPRGIDLFEGPLQVVLVRPGYTTEDASSFYTTEDGLNIYIPESI